MGRAIVLAAVVVWGMLFAPSIGEAAPRKRPPKKPAPAKPAPPPEPAPAPEPVPVAAPVVQPAEKPPNKRTLAVLEVRIEGLPDDLRQEFEKELVGSLDTSSYWVSPSDRVHERMGFSTRWTDGCVIGECMREVKAQTGADIALLVALSGSGTSFGHVVTIVRTDTGKVFAQRSGRCEMCVVDKVMHEVILATIDLVNSVPENLPDEDAQRSAGVELAVNKLVKRIDADAARTRRKAITLTLVGVAIGAVGAGLYFAADQPDIAMVVGGAGGGMALGGISLLVF